MIIIIYTEYNIYRSIMSYLVNSRQIVRDEQKNSQVLHAVLCRKNVPYASFQKSMQSPSLSACLPLKALSPRPYDNTAEQIQAAPPVQETQRRSQAHGSSGSTSGNISISISISIGIGTEPLRTSAITGY